MSDDCGLPDGVMHMHSDRCYGAGRREVVKRAEAAEAALERVRTLATEWQRSDHRTWISTCGDSVVDALDGDR